MLKYIQRIKIYSIFAGNKTKGLFNMKKVAKTKELYVRPSLSHLREMFFPLGWDVVEDRNEDYPFNTTDVYIVHTRATSVMSTTIAQMLTFWLYEFQMAYTEPRTGKKCIRLINF